MRPPAGGHPTTPHIAPAGTRRSQACSTPPSSTRGAGSALCPPPPRGWRRHPSPLTRSCCGMSCMYSFRGHCSVLLWGRTRGSGGGAPASPAHVRQPRPLTATRHSQDLPLVHVDVRGQPPLRPAVGLRPGLLGGKTGRGQEWQVPWVRDEALVPRSPGLTSCHSMTPLHARNLLLTIWTGPATPPGPTACGRRQVGSYPGLPKEGAWEPGGCPRAQPRLGPLPGFCCQAAHRPGGRPSTGPTPQPPCPRLGHFWVKRTL